MFMVRTRRRPLHSESVLLDTPAAMLLARPAAKGASRPLRLHVRVSMHPVPSGRLPVVLVHGLARSGRSLEPLGEWLASYHRVHTPDLPGFGLSDKPRDILDTIGHADALGAYLDAAGLATVAVVGHSNGSHVAAHLAARQPTRVGALVLIGHSCGSAPSAATRRLDAARDLMRAGLRRAWRTYRRSLNDRMEEVLPRIDAPALVISASREPAAARACAEKAARLLPRGRLVVLPAAPDGAPEQLALRIHEFLETAGAAPDLQRVGAAAS
jgi:2-hydroxy-6-oxonona-2,4-dienedioate hydrolase